MALIADAPVDDPTAPELSEESPPRRPRTRLRRRLLAVGGGLLLFVAAGALWFFLGREQAAELSEDKALADFRAGGGESSEVAGLPAAGVYAATASGTESIGLPGFDEQFGPDAPVTVIHDDGGCFTYRADLNSHHWRAWTFCPTDSATFALTRLDSWTARKAPGLEIDTTTTYTCERPLDFFWETMAAGDTRTSACSGASDYDDSVTDDAGRIEVLGTEQLALDGESVDVVHTRTVDAFSGAQSGEEVAEWWIHAGTGLPVKLSIRAHLEGGPTPYGEDPSLELSTLTPAT